MNEEAREIQSEPLGPEEAKRRNVLWGGVVVALTAAYGTLTAYAARFIFPPKPDRPPRKIFIGFSHEINPGESKSIALPSGEQMLVSNTGAIDAKTGSAYLGFSNRCPHLGCRVHYNAQDKQFVCPCHQGVFDSAGVAISGPPAEAGQVLKSYTIELDGQSMYAVLEDA